MTSKVFLVAAKMRLWVANKRYQRARRNMMAEDLPTVAPTVPTAPSPRPLPVPSMGVKMLLERNHMPAPSPGVQMPLERIHLPAPFPGVRMPLERTQPAWQAVLSPLEVQERLARDGLYFPRSLNPRVVEKQVEEYFAQQALERA